MTLAIIGLGPGDPGLITPQTAAAIAAARHLVGYAPYLDRIPPAPGQIRHASDNRVELDRARHALGLATSGEAVAVISGGDPGIFAMAAAVFEAIEAGPAAWRSLDVQVLPGVSAMLAAAARLGAPLGHDFAVMSLSDNLKPWPLILHRLAAAAAAGFVIVLYNPASKARPWQLAAALDALRPILPATTPVAFATAISRLDERLVVATLATADPTLADMRTLVLIGAAATRVLPGPNGDRLYTPRSAT